MAGEAFIHADYTNTGSMVSSGISHTVQPNEDLISIAKLYAVTVDEIVALNQLPANRSIQIGQRLQIP